jgi:hypothetical protein
LAHFFEVPVCFSLRSLAAKGLPLRIAKMSSEKEIGHRMVDGMSSFREQFDTFTIAIETSMRQIAIEHRAEDKTNESIQQELIEQESVLRDHATESNKSAPSSQFYLFSISVQDT